MGSRIEIPAEFRAIQRLARVQAGITPGSRAHQELRFDLLSEVRGDHLEMLRTSTDRFGRPFAPLAASTLKNPRRGPDRRPLIPHGEASGLMIDFELGWEGDTLVGRYARDTARWARYHATGTRRMPARDTAGISLRGRARVEAVHRAYIDRLLRG